AYDAGCMAAPPDQLRSAVRFPGDVLVAFDGDGRCSWVTPSIERVLGHPAADAAAHLTVDLVHPDDLPRVREAWAQVAGHDGAEASAEARVRHADGSWRWLDVALAGSDDGVVALL